MTGEDLSRYWLTDQDLRISSFGGKSRPHKYAYGSVHFKTKADGVARFLTSLRLIKENRNRPAPENVSTEEPNRNIVFLQFIFDRNNQVAEQFDDWAANMTQHILWSDASAATGIDTRDLKAMVRQFTHRGWISDEGPVQRIDQGFLATITDRGLAELEQRPQFVAIKGEVNVVITRVEDLGLPTDVARTLQSLVEQFEAEDSRESKAQRLRAMLALGADSVTTVDGLSRFLPFMASLAAQIA